MECANRAWCALEQACFGRYDAAGDREKAAAVAAAAADAADAAAAAASAVTTLTPPIASATAPNKHVTLVYNSMRSTHNVRLLARERPKTIIL